VLETWYIIFCDPTFRTAAFFGAFSNCIFWGATFAVLINLAIWMPEDYNVIIVAKWCVRCLLITESPKTPGPYRYLILVSNFGSSSTSLIWDRRCSVCDLSCSCVYCDFEFLRFVFSTLKSRSCLQLTNSCLIWGHEGYNMLSFLLPIGIFSKWFGGF